MLEFGWNEDKNTELKGNKTRAVGFEDIVTAMKTGGLLDNIISLNAVKYPHQRMYVVLFKGYVYAVPYVQDGIKVFLKTIYPSRKLTQTYLKGAKNE